MCNKVVQSHAQDRPPRSQAEALQTTSNLVVWRQVGFVIISEQMVASSSSSIHLIFLFFVFLFFYKQ